MISISATGHNDNKYDGWVTEFAAKLERELSATLKDKLSIWFDKNPEDKCTAALDEILPVNKKLNHSFLFRLFPKPIAIPESPVWKGEFSGFHEESKNDNIGSTVKLANGNMVSRVIPVKIHDIDTEDIKLLESELSGGLRSVDFIYREDGVNRPLRPVMMRRMQFACRPLYRNQINKLANAIKEIITGDKAKRQS